MLACTETDQGKAFISLRSVRVRCWVGFSVGERRNPPNGSRFIELDVQDSDSEPTQAEPTHSHTGGGPIWVPQSAKAKPG